MGLPKNGEARRECASVEKSGSDDACRFHFTRRDVPDVTPCPGLGRQDAVS